MTGIDLYSPNPPLYRRALARVYGGLMRFRAWFYTGGLSRPLPLPARVISIGNLTVGGTGKTPLVMAVVRELTARGIKAAVISRGYRGKAAGAVNVVSDGQTVRLGPSLAGDEPYLMATSLPGTPVITGKRRIAAGREAVTRFGAQVLVLDDGFQHMGMARDVNLLLLDAHEPFANGYLLPAGPLREPATAAARATAFVLTRAPETPVPAETALPKMFPGRPVFKARHKPVRLIPMDEGDPLPLEHLKGKPVLGFCGLARPELFARTLADIGAASLVLVRWPDHYRPTDDDLAVISAKAKELGLTEAVTTTKDLARLGGREVAGVRVLALEIEMDVFSGREELFRKILGEEA